MRFVTHNIHFGVGRNGYADLDRIAAAIDGADVVALQEVERYWPRSGMVDQPRKLGKRLPDYWWVYWARTAGRSMCAVPPCPNAAVAARSSWPSKRRSP